MTSAETLEGVRKAKRSKEKGMWKLMNGERISSNQVLV